MKKTSQVLSITPRKGLMRKNLLSWCVLSAVIFFASSCENNLDKTAPSIDASARASGSLGINVLLNTAINDGILATLNQYGTVQKTLPSIKALTMRIPAEKLPSIQSLSFVAAANPDRQRDGSPIDTVPIPDFSEGRSTWNLDAINVTDTIVGRTLPQTGSGVYVGILDTGLLDAWRQYFPQERIAEEYATSFGGGGNDNGNVSQQPNKWEHDQNSHGTHVASTILGFKLGTTYFNGVAPEATIIPVKVLDQTGHGRGWSSVIAQGIVYITDLKRGPLSGSPVVINMSLGGPELDAMEQAAVNYATANGVIIVAAAGNEGEEGMHYPGAYAPVISAASAGWKDNWEFPTWWRGDFPDPTNVNDLYISDFSSRAQSGQDLDVVAPGSYVVGPYQVNSGQTSYYYLSGTSMATPHVTGIVALMLQVRNNLTNTQAETVLESAALPMPAGSRSVRQPDGSFVTVSWGADATGHGFITADAALATLALNP
jgi:subtilisin family serine protease